MMQFFYEALANACRADNSGANSLVSLTSHSVNDFRIARGQPPFKAKYPFLAFYDRTTFPFVNDSHTGWYKTVVEFYCIDKTDVKAIQIADRLDTLFRPANANQGKQYWNITDAKIQNNQTRWEQRDKPELDDDTSVWMVTVTASFVWHLL